MKNLFFVSAAISVFSGTSLTAKAQPSVNIERLTSSVQVEKSANSVGGPEINLTTASRVADRSISGNEGTAIEKCSALQFKYALLLDMDVEAVTNEVLYNEIEKWWATRYRYGGTNGKGIDCSAYTGALLSDVYGLNVSRTARAQFAESEKIEKEDLQEGDLVFFNTGRGVSHVGLYLGNGYFTHAGSSTGVTISNLDETYWQRKFLRGGRIASTASCQTE
ncbi:MAG: C40 family peptidase [Chitinophagaceae bacterium]|nr:C40 family peptidase [Chitinophagaceae bacterium]